MSRIVCRDTTHRLPRHREVKGPTPHSVAVVSDMSSHVSVSSWKLRCHVCSGGTHSDSDTDSDTDSGHSVRQSVNRLLVQIFLVSF